MRQAGKPAEPADRNVCVTGQALSLTNPFVITAGKCHHPTSAGSMKKVALVFVLAVIIPSLVLAWLAVRSLSDQQFLLERQQSLLYQGVADALARNVLDTLGDDQRQFTARVSEFVQAQDPQVVAKTFDAHLRKEWPLAQVGFVVTLTGDILCPTPFDSPETRIFCADNSRFLGNRESAEVYWNSKPGNYANAGNNLNNNLINNTAANGPAQNPSSINSQKLAPQSEENQQPNSQPNSGQGGGQGGQQSQPDADKKYAKISNRSVIPQQGFQQKSGLQEDVQQQQFSKVAASEAEFRQLIGEADEGTLARFVDNKLNILLWHRSARDGRLIFGAQLALDQLKQQLRPLLQELEPALRDEICVALLDDTARAVATSHADFHPASWKRPFVATEIGETLPHWELAVYLLNPAKLSQSANTLKLTLGLLVALLLLAIAVGSWLIVSDLNRQLTLARQKTDFVSNVSHELKTPLTSIRMFSELLAEGRVIDPAKQRSYLSIITAETARLTRLINNVLDFARMERGEKKYTFQKCELVQLVRETCEVFRPHLESEGFQFDVHLPETVLNINCDRDALAQIVVNLLSNAEKYSGDRKEISVELSQQTDPLPFIELKVLDRGLGVPENCREKIFEQFYRTHDSLSSGIQGSGLGLTLTRQIARAHGGEIACEPREGGGSIFILRLPSKPVP
jgi:signal transduction histidine kinase